MSKGEPFNLTSLIKAYAESEQIPAVEAKRRVNAVIHEVAKGLKRHKKVSIGGFVTITIGTRKKRVGRNPKTGEPINIPAKKALKFKAFKAFTDDVGIT